MLRRCDDTRNQVDEEASLIDEVSCATFLDALVLKPREGVVRTVALVDNSSACAKQG
jgi:hypothetical protein